MGILEKMRLDGKTAFVTGGARGIGKSVAAALCEAGSNVAVSYTHLPARSWSIAPRKP